MGSMTAAAAALGYTTGAVSQQMAALQRSVRTELFTQVGRRVQLTDAGHLLADHAVGLLALARQTEQALAGLPGRPRARVLVGVFGTAAAALLPRALVRVRERHPEIHLRSVEVDVDDATAAVAAGRVDLAFGVDHPQAPIPRASDVALLVLATERFSIATPVEATPGAGPRCAGARMEPHRAASSSWGSVKGSSCASATGWLTRFPSRVLRPRRRAGSAWAAPVTPCRATRTRYGSVAEVRARVEVRATAPGMLATQ